MSKPAWLVKAEDVFPENDPALATALDYKAAPDYEPESEGPKVGVFDLAGILGRSSTSGPRFLTGIVALDERLSPPQDRSRVGLPLGRIVGINGPPHAGKSVMADQLALAAARSGLRVVLLGTDEPREDAAERIGQGLGFRHAELNGDYPETLDRLRGAECYQNISILPDEELGELTIEEAGKILLGVPGPGHVLVVDSLHKSRSSAEAEKDMPRVAIEKRMAAFRAFRERGALVIFTAEANRATYASNDPAQKGTAMASGAEGRSIEFGADLLLVLSRDRDDVHVEVPKNRIGRRCEPFTLRLSVGSASFHSVSEEAVQMEKQGKRAEGLLALEYKILELLGTVPEGMSQRSIEAEKLGFRDDIREAVRSALAKGKLHRVPYPRGSGYLFRVGPDPLGARGAREVREGCAGAPTGTGVGGARADYKEARTSPPRQPEITFEEKEESAHPETVRPPFHHGDGDRTGSRYTSSRPEPESTTPYPEVPVPPVIAEEPVPFFEARVNRVTAAPDVSPASAPVVAPRHDAILGWYEDELEEP